MKIYHIFTRPLKRFTLYPSALPVPDIYLYYYVYCHAALYGRQCVPRIDSHCFGFLTPLYLDGMMVVVKGKNYII